MIKEIHILFNTNGRVNADSLDCMVRELTELGVYDTTRNVVVYDDADEELSARVLEIFNRYLPQ